MNEISGSILPMSICSCYIKNEGNQATGIFVRGRLAVISTGWIDDNDRFVGVHLMDPKSDLGQTLLDELKADESDEVFCSKSVANGTVFSALMTRLVCEAMQP